MVEIRTIRLWEEDWYLPFVNGTPLPPMWPGRQGMLTAIAIVLWEENRIDFEGRLTAKEFMLAEKSLRRKQFLVQRFLEDKALRWKDALEAPAAGKEQGSGLGGHGVVVALPEEGEPIYTAIDPTGRPYEPGDVGEEESIDESHGLEGYDPTRRGY